MAEKCVKLQVRPSRPVKRVHLRCCEMLVMVRDGSYRHGSDRRRVGDVMTAAWVVAWRLKYKYRLEPGIESNQKQTLLLYLE